MSASGNGSGHNDFKAGGVLQNPTPASTGGDTKAFESAGGIASTAAKVGGGKKRRTKTGLVHFKKGSKEAKEFMAKLRAMRGTKGGRRRRKGTQKAGGDEDGDNKVPPMLGENEKECPIGKEKDINGECVDESAPPLGQQASSEPLQTMGGKRRRKHKSAKKVMGGRRRRSSKKSHKGKKYSLW